MCRRWVVCPSLSIAVTSTTKYNALISSAKNLVATFKRAFQYRLFVSSTCQLRHVRGGRCAVVRINRCARCRYSIWGTCFSLLLWPLPPGHQICFCWRGLFFYIWNLKNTKFVFCRVWTFEGPSCSISSLAHPYSVRYGKVGLPPPTFFLVWQHLWTTFKNRYWICLYAAKKYKTSAEKIVN